MTISSLLCVIASYLVNAVWGVTLIGGAGWLVSRTVRRLGAQIEHVIWVTTLMLAVVAPLLPLYRTLPGLFHAPGAAAASASMIFVAAQTGRAMGSSGIFLPPWLIQVLSYLYLGALLYFAARLGRSIVRTIALFRGVRPISLCPGSAAVWDRAKQAFGVEDALIFESRWIPGPLAAGFRHPVLLVPDGFTEQCAPQDLLAALAHECAHMQRRDFQKNLCYEIASLTVAFHPVLWFVKSQIAQTREMICDEKATKVMDQRAYTRSLLRLVSIVPFAARVAKSNAVGIFDADILEKRITMMRTKKQPVSSILKCGLLLVGSLFLLAAAGGIGTIARPIQQQTAAAQANSDSAKNKRLKNLSCTYWAHQNRPYEGTCGWRKGDTTTPYCFRNDDMNISEVQIGCVDKLGKPRADTTH